ncbi:MAG: hypothetical protein EOO41_04185 [Methanobacteriota archaeon]|nr:MAG: hypothetical protein EOO41_04185 [Euryarchaeota archaeon]
MHAVSEAATCGAGTLQSLATSVLLTWACQPFESALAQEPSGAWLQLLAQQLLFAGNMNDHVITLQLMGAVRSLLCAPAVRAYRDVVDACRHLLFDSFTRTLSKDTAAHACAMIANASMADSCLAGSGGPLQGADEAAGESSSGMSDVARVLASPLLAALLHMLHNAPDQ